jgi:translocation and assembly module TamB
MVRRRVIVLASALAMIVVGAVAAVVTVAFLGTTRGRDLLAGQVTGYLNRRFTGRVHVGRIGGSLLTDLTVDSLEIRDDEDSVVVATGPIALRYDPRDLFDRRVLLRDVRVLRPAVHLRKRLDGTWTHDHLLRRGPGPRAPSTGRGFGSLVVVDGLTVVDGAFRLTMPWAPPDSLRGARRDSAIAFNLTRPDAVVRRVAGGFMRTWHWTRGALEAPRVRLAHPDSAGQRVELARLDVDEADPPFAIRGAAGEVVVRRDTVFVTLDRFTLPGSRGRARGTVVSGRDGAPTRYDLRVVGDTVALSDVAWISPTLPREGGGRMRLHIRNAARDPEVIEYALDELDVRTVHSRITGAMTFGVGGPVLALTETDLRLDPVDFRLLEAMAQEPFEYPWRGTLRGTVRARGGPLTRWRVDDARLTFTDANVRGAVNRLSGRGELNILEPALAVFRGFRLTVDALDLRTPRAVNPDFPALGGTVRGIATLDSVWTDVRFREADLTHVDGDGPPSRFTGVGRVTLEDSLVRFDVALDAAPVSFTTLARSYPGLPPAGTFSGPVTARGTAADFTLVADVLGDAGRLVTDLRFDIVPPGYAAEGTFAVRGAALRAFAGAAGLDGEVGMTGRAAVRGDSLADLQGTVGVDVGRSTVDALRILDGELRLRFGGGRMRVDTARFASPAGTLDARGGLGLVAGIRDSLHVVAVVDSLGGLRPWLTAADAPRADSLAGTLGLDAWLAGSIDTLDLRARLAGEGLLVGTTAVATLTGDAALTDVAGRRRGHVTLTADTAGVAGLAISRAVLDARLADPATTAVTLAVTSATGPRLDAAAIANTDAAETRLRLDSLALTLPDQTWRLAAPATMRLGPTGAIALDAAALVGARSGRIEVAGALGADSGVVGRLVARGVPLADLGRVAQSTASFQGAVDVDVEVAGTRAAPLVSARATTARWSFGGAALDSLVAAATYADRALTTTVTYGRAATGRLTADATLPLDLALLPRASRRLDAPLRGRVRTDGVSLAVLEAFTPAVREASGIVRADVALGGRWDAPTLRGTATVAEGSLLLPDLGTRWRELTADIAFHDDSVAIRRVAARGRRDGPGTLELRGWVRVDSLADPAFDLRVAADRFTAVDRARIATLDLSGDLRLAGRVRASDLSGGLTVDAGTVYIPEVVTKNVISLDDPEFYNIVDTATFANRTLTPRGSSRLVRGLSADGVRVTMGPQVWLRSAEANINLGGSLTVNGGRDAPGAAPLSTLSLAGALTTERGTYRLDLGLVQRTFEVEQGSVTFFGEPDVNPTLAINALYTTRAFDARAAQQDVRVRVTIGGTLLQPSVALSSPDSARLGGSADLISYLVTGRPSLEIGGRANDYGATATQLLIGSASSVLTSRLGNGLFDQVVLSGAAGGPGVDGTTNLLSGARLDLGKQLNDRAYLRLDAGLCQVGNLLGGGGRFDPVSFTDALGVKVDYRFEEGILLSAGIEPPSSALLCGRGEGARGFAPTPRQWGFDLFRAWKF